MPCPSKADHTAAECVSPGERQVAAHPPSTLGKLCLQAGKLTASDAESGDHFGISVAISGDTTVVGAYSEDGAGSDRGAAYVFGLREAYVYLPLVLRQ